jgi:hypothetical protein
VYRLEAVIADATLLHGEVAILRDGLGLLLAKRRDADLPSLSRPGPVAHVEVDFFGGDGYQTAEVWRAGAPVWGPVHDDRFDGPREDWPVNAALAHLGVTPSGTARDLFEQVGLGLHRDEPDWRRYAKSGRTPADLIRHRDADLSGLPADLDARTVMRLLSIPPGPRVGEALHHLRRLRRDNGAPLTRDQAEAALLAWARSR